MRHYGQVKGFRFDADQPRADEKSGKRRCARCGAWRPKSAYVKDGMGTTVCADCRTARVKPDGEARCSKCKKSKPLKEFRDGRITFKCCNACREKNKQKRREPRGTK